MILLKTKPLSIEIKIQVGGKYLSMQVSLNQYSNLKFLNQTNSYARGHALKILFSKNYYKCFVHPIFSSFGILVTLVA